MKIHQSLVSRTMEGLFSDSLVTFPDHQNSILKQKDVSFRLMEEHGLAFATLVLPSLGKWFDHCLEEGRIPSGDRPLYAGRRGSTIYPKYHWYLWEMIFDNDGVLRENPNHDAILYLREHLLFAKKLDITCEEERTVAAVADFIQLEHRLPSSLPNTWDSDIPEWGDRHGHPIYGTSMVDSRQNDLFPPDEGGDLPRFRWKVFRALCRVLATSFGHLDVLSLEPKHGPGAVSDKVEGIKYDFDIWPKRLNAIFPADWFASHDFHDRTKSDREIGSIMHAVPKTQKGPRLIAAEPTAHQWAQGAIQRWLEMKVKESPLSLSIDFKNQSYSQALARESSLTRDFATIDLSEASDRLTTRLVEYVFQGHLPLLDCLHACRTRFITIPANLVGDGRDRTILLKKFSTMGSAVTFPIQTIVFTMLGHFALMTADEDWDVSLRAMRQRSHRIRVFGDDIIIDNKAYGIMVALLKECLLKVNEAKSFHKGSFREACGMDAFEGVDVTPAYIRKPYSPRNPESLNSVVECSNNFHKKGFWHTAAAVLKTVPAKELKLIIRSHQDVWPTSVFSFCNGTDLEGIKTRWNPNLHRNEALILTLLSRGAKVRGSGEASLIQYFTERPDLASLSKWEAGQPRRPQHKKQLRWVELRG